MINDPLYNALLKDISTYIKTKPNIDLITKAYNLAKEKHLGQMRQSGEPYITHPLAVARILTELQTGPVTIVAGLLHDTVEDTDLTLDDLRLEFGEDVASLVDALTKLNKLSFAPINQADNQQKMLIAMAKDIRVIIIKLADRIHNMRTLEHLSPDKQVRIAKETLEIFAPIAHRLGLFRWKAELEDRSLRFVDPAMYYKVSNLIKAKKVEREQSIENVINYLKGLFKDADIIDYEIKGRIKNIYSIYKKMVLSDRAFEDIYDLLAVRIIVDKVETCYQTLGIIHANFTPIPKRFKDYIAVPKPNMYQSLHTTVLYQDGELFEIQIRTHEMDMVAEYGIAAHWAYKENKTYSKEREQFEIASHLKWYAELLKITEDSDEKDNSSEEFVDTIKTDIFTANVYVFTPKGEVVELPTGGTPIDFAYKIHTDVGHKMVGAVVNNKMVPINYKLKTGDIVSIKTNKNSSGPSEDWLKIAQSSSARHKIKAFLNRANYDYLLSSGKLSLEKELKDDKITREITDDWVLKNFQKNSLTNVQGLYLEIGKGNISPRTVIKKLVPTDNREELLKRQLEKTTRQLIATSDTGVIVEGLTSPQLRLSNCCTPVLGDEIVGYVTKGSGIVVHRKDCPNVNTYENNRLIKAYWGTNIKRKYATWLKIVGTTRENLLTEVIQVTNSVGSSIAEVSLVQTPKLESIIKLKISVNNKDELNNLILNIKKISQIYLVERDQK